jgi:hypothetical protein
MRQGLCVFLVSVTGQLWWAILVGINKRCNYPGNPCSTPALTLGLVPVWLKLN